MILHIVTFSPASESPIKNSSTGRDGSTEMMDLSTSPLTESSFFLPEFNTEDLIFLCSPT